LPNGVKGLDKIRRVVSGLQSEESGLAAQKTRDLEKQSSQALWTFWTGFSLDGLILLSLSLFLYRAIQKQAKAEKDFQSLRKLVDSLERNNSEISNLDNLVKSLQIVEVGYFRVVAL